MKNISSNVINKFRNGEFLQFAKIMVEIYGQNNANDLQLSDRLTAVQNAVNELESVFQNSTAHVLTPELKALDLQRLNLMRAIKKIGESYLLRGEDFAKPADMLVNNYQLHGSKLNRLSLPQITASINALLDDWSGMPGYPEAVEKLGLQEWTAKLQEANKAFNDLYVKRIQTTQQTARITDRRADIKALLDELMQDTEAHYRLAKDKEPYAEIRTNVTNLFAKFTTLINSRSADRSKDKESDEMRTSYPSEDVC